MSVSPNWGCNCRNGHLNIEIGDIKQLFVKGLKLKFNMKNARRWCEDNESMTDRQDGLVVPRSTLKYRHEHGSLASFVYTRGIGGGVLKKSTRKHRTMKKVAHYTSSL
jgi:hypothetical protein